MSYYVGVDVGTSSVRAALFTNDGRTLAKSAQPIKVHQPQADYFEQSSEDIWNSCCSVVREVCSDVDVSLVVGVGFDATCSLVVLDSQGQPVSVSPTGDGRYNIVMWLDHRASEETKRINTTKHAVLQCVGGTMSVEMQTPKLLWIKQELPECWQKAAHFMDLPDFLTWKATGSLSRSLCSLVCKWTYLGDPDALTGWSESYFKQIGLQDLVNDNFSRLGQDVLSPGTPCGDGLSPAAAAALGLPPGTPVGASIIDAHAGALGSLSCQGVGVDSRLAMSHKMALICGTSACHITLSECALFVAGVWGPYHSAILPDLWVNEGGQSSFGNLLDHLLESNKAYPLASQKAEERGIHVHTLLNEVLASLPSGSMHELTRHLHVWPDFHGNRSPLADASLKGMICGLTLSAGIKDLACLYLATIQALAYGTLHIIDTMKKSSFDIQVIYASGGLAKNDIFMQTLADVLGLPIVLPSVSEPVLLGAAMLGACASQKHGTLQDVMIRMGGDGKVLHPRSAHKEYHTKKYAVFLKMLQHQREYQRLME